MNFFIRKKKRNMGCVESCIDRMCYKEVQRSKGPAPAFSDPEKQAAYDRTQDRNKHVEQVNFHGK